MLNNKCFSITVSGKLYDFTTNRGHEARIFYKDNIYSQTNTKAGIPVINQILKDYSFTRKDFSNPYKATNFLEFMVGLYDNSAPVVGSDVFLKSLDKFNSVGTWVDENKKKEVLFRKLCHDLEFVFEGEKWTVVFNVFYPDGSVKEWKIIGEFDPNTNSNKIYEIDRRIIKRKGTFSYLQLG